MQDAVQGPTCGTPHVAATGLAGYDQLPELDGQQWRTLIETADRLVEVVAGHELRMVRHPHVVMNVCSSAAFSTVR